MPDALDRAVYAPVVAGALAEDVGAGDVTTDAVVPAGATAAAALVVKRACVLCGLDVAREVFSQVDPAVAFEAARRDGDRCDPGAVVARVSGPARALLTAERTALNLLQHLSGIATMTRACVDAADGRTAILDTRKTLPGLRALARYAVRCGGGVNHRFGLFDGVIVKDNHIRHAGGIAAAVARLRAAGRTMPIEVEAQSMDDVDAAIEAGADVIMLDNLSTDQMRTAIARIDGRARVEISGGVTPDRVADLSRLGADAMSIGALTHSVQAADISLEFDAP
jgi:nicotinate-nucleotide pyrophosphorylase (carboxylating)